MQEMQNPRGQVEREFFAAQTRSQATAAMDARRKELEAKGYKFIGRKKIGRNDPCPCGSRKKFKRCCISKMAGAFRDQFANPPA